MDTFEEVDVEQAKSMIDQGSVTVVDVRGREHYEQGHIQGAVLVDDENIEDFVGSTDKKKPILCYCFMGFSSQKAAQYFIDNGFEKAYSMTGGFTQWSKTYDSSTD